METTTNPPNFRGTDIKSQHTHIRHRNQQSHEGTTHKIVRHARKQTTLERRTSRFYVRRFEGFPLLRPLPIDIYAVDGTAAGKHLFSLFFPRKTLWRRYVTCGIHCSLRVCSATSETVLRVSCGCENTLESANIEKRRSRWICGFGGDECYAPHMPAKVIRTSLRSIESRVGRLKVGRFGDMILFDFF